MFPGPLLLLIGPLLLAGVLFLLRRWPVVTAVLGALAVLILARMVAAIPLDNSGIETASPLFAGDTLAIYGRTFVLTDEVQAVVRLLYQGVALLMLLAAVAPQGRLFVPLCLLLLSPLAGLLMVQPFLIGILLLLVVMALVAMLIQGGQPGSTLAASRSLVLATVAVCLLLVAGWMMGADQATFLTSIWQLWLLGIVILLAGFPFHIWVRPAVTESPSLVPAVVFGLVHFALVSFSFSLWQENPWLQQNAQFGVLARGLGAATVAAAALLTFNAAGFGRLLAYTLLADIGATVMTLPVGGAAGQDALLSVLLLRFISLALAGTGLGLLRAQMPSDSWAAAGGLARRSPGAVILFAYGLISLAGLPVTPGFAGRWAVLGLAAAQSPWLAGLLLLAAASTLVGLWRMVAVILAPVEIEAPPSSRQILLAEAAAVVVLVGGSIFALFPQLLLNLL
jgi:NADH:ubiquinone oxidoreductase subunit 2 (subunit N)